MHITTKKNYTVRPYVFFDAHSFWRNTHHGDTYMILTVNLIFFSQTSSSFSKVATSSCSKEAITKTTGTKLLQICKCQPSNLPATSGHHLGEAIIIFTFIIMHMGS